MERTPQHRLNEEQLTFLLDILDDRHEIEEHLEAKHSRIEVFAEDYVTRTRLPEELRDFTRVDQPVDLTIGVQMLHDRYGKTSGEIALRIVPDDRAPFTVKNDHGFVTIEQMDTTYLTNDRTFSETLWSLVGGHTDQERPSRLSDNYLLDVMVNFSRNASRVYTFEHIDPEQAITIQLQKNETRSDSREILSVELLRPHPSDAWIGTRLILNESLNERSKDTTGQQVNQTTDITIDRSADESDRLLTVQSIIDSKDVPIPVRKITPYHMSDIIDAIYQLKNAPKI